MKRFNKTYLPNMLSVVLAVTLLFSCQELEEDPKGLLVNESFFKTESDLEAAVTAVYFPLAESPWGGFGSTRVWVPLMGGDDLTTHPGSNKQDFREFDRFAASSLNPALKTAAWQIPFAIVYAANNVLENFHRIDGREEIINQAVGQVRFLRAFAYFWMVRIFGDLPIITSVVPDLEVSRSPVSDVYAFILEDLQFAEKNLPESWPGEPGRATVWAAKGMMAQVYLTMAGWPLKDESKYAMAAQKAKEVIDNSPHMLLENFADLWTIDADNNLEVVWSLQFCSLTNCSTPWVMTHGGSTTKPAEENGWDDLFFEVGFYNRFPEGPRKEATFHTVFADSIPFENSVTAHPYIAKYRDGTIAGEGNYQHDFFTSRNMNYLRFAEVLLIYAEAQAMASGTPDESAYEAIDRVRNRAGLEDLEKGLSAMQFRDAVIDERGWELAAEFSRWFDLVRTEKVEEMNALKADADMKPLNSIDKGRYFAPIPYSEILLNPNLGQNESYE